MQNFLYDISSRYKNLLEAEDTQSDGEAIAAIKAALIEVGGEIETAVASGIGYLQNQAALVEAVKAEEKRLKEYRESIERRIARVRKGYTEFLISTNNEKVETSRGKMLVPAPTYRTIIDDAGKIPADYTRQTVKVEPDKSAIKQAIEMGKTIPGAHLEPSRIVQIR